MATFRSRSRSTARSASHRRRPGSPLPSAPPQRPFLTAIEELNRGAVPSNDQLKGWLRYFETSLGVQDSRMSPAGQRLVSDLRELVRLFERVIDTKNSDGLLQRFFTHSRLAGKLAMRSLNRSGRIQVVDEPRRKVYLFGGKDTERAAISREQRREAMKEVRALYRLLQMLLASPELRGAVGQLQEIATMLFPALLGTEQQPQQRVRAGPSKSVSFDQQKEQRAFEQQREEKISRGKPESGMSTTELDQSIEQLRRQVRETEVGLTDLEQSTGYRNLSAPLQEGQVRMESTSTEGSWMYISQGAKQAQETSGKERVAKEEPQIRRLGTEMPELSPEETERLPIFGAAEEEEERVEIGRYTHEEPVKYEAEEQRVPETGGYGGAGLSEAQKRDIIGRLRVLLGSIGGNTELRHAIRDAVNYASNLQAYTTGTSGLVPAELQYEENIRAAQRDLLEILERLSGANVARIGPLLGRIRGQMATDYELKDFIGDWQAFLRRCSKDPGYLESPEWEQRAHFLLDRTEAVGQGKYAGPFRELVQAVQDFLQGWKQDQLTGQIGTVLQRILKQDLMGATEEEGRRGSLMMAMMRPDLMQDFRHVILPSMLRNLHEIPLPRIESISDGDRLVLENVVVPAGGFIPDDLDVRQSSTLRMSPKERLLGSMRAKVRRMRSGWTNAVRIRM